MNFRVHVIADGEDDILDIYNYILLNDSVVAAEYVLRKLEETCVKLAQNPERGHFPPELERIGVSEYREIHYKPYLIIYKISNRDVFIYCVLDGRRELQELLERRLLR
ncbi:MAG: type II toxin-antitoxin system RelE/ParE family toxin [Chitinivibrionales bacterium]|nr:type II toxin-antitoxin system RelE/ParE family toxin [Chitinivibrionales bacterium]MBD3395031.1 type II toxin-antitoxin system RelE/ParE family toxin [Chitinivibrionales bacterium]